MCSSSARRIASQSRGGKALRRSRSSSAAASASVRAPASRQRRRWTRTSAPPGRPTPHCRCARKSRWRGSLLFVPHLDRSLSRARRLAEGGVPGVLRSGGGGGRRLRGRLLLLLGGGGLGLLEERARVDAAAVELTLEGQEILAVVLLERVGAGGAGADAQRRRDVLPRLVLGALQMTEAS